RLGPISHSGQFFSGKTGLSTLSVLSTEPGTRLRDLSASPVSTDNLHGMVLTKDDSKFVAAAQDRILVWDLETNSAPSSFLQASCFVLGLIKDDTMLVTNSQTPGVAN